MRRCWRWRRSGAKVLQTRSVEMAMNHRVPRAGAVELRRQARHAGRRRGRDRGKGSRQRHRLQPRRGEDHADRVADRPGVAAAIFGPLADANINVDMIVQNVSEDGNTTDLTFTVRKADLDRAVAVLEDGTSRDRLRRSWCPTPTWPRSRSSASACAAMPASPRRCSRRWPKGHQHPGDLHLGDQGQRADRRANTPSWPCARCTRPTGSTRPDHRR